MLTEKPTGSSLEEQYEYLKELVRSLQWRSVDKDNMEFETRATCFWVDEMQKILDAN